jgi:hypothetical protein
VQQKISAKDKQDEDVDFFFKTVTPGKCIVENLKSLQHVSIYL